MLPTWVFVYFVLMFVKMITLNKRKMKFRFSTFVSIVSLAAMTVLGVGCQDDKLPEDENNFTLTYGTLAITNTAESNGNILAAPDWTGKTPSR